MSPVEWKGIAAGNLLLAAGAVGFAVDNPGLKLVGLFGVLVLVFFIVDAYRKRGKYDPRRKMDAEKVGLQDLYRGDPPPPRE
jgi:hypothetical protein